MSFTPHYLINKENNFSSSCIVKLNALSPDKLYFSENSYIHFPRLIDFEINNSMIKKSCHYHEDFEKSHFIYFRNFDIDKDAKFLLPSFQCESFKCLGCQKLHNMKTSKCCDMTNSPIEIIKARLSKIKILKTDININIINNRNDFLKLHFPNLMDMIIIK